MTTSLLVTVDTEEDDAWSDFRATGNAVRNAAGLDRFQRLCDKHGVSPTYLVDEPVIDDHLAIEKLSKFQRDGRAEIGAHLHPWCGQPYEEEINDRNSYLCNLPESLQRAKLEHLTKRIEETFGRPTSFRAGRYGLDHVGAGILTDLGYVVDSSVIPFTNYAAQHGPNFENAPHRPYYPSSHDLCTPIARGDLLEIPVGVGFNRSNFARAKKWRDTAMAPGLRQLRMVGILDRLGIAQRIKLSPEQSDASRMKTLIDALREQQAPCAVLMLHSSSLIRGTSPYVRTEEALGRLFRRLDDVFAYCRVRLQMCGPTLSEFASEYRQHHASRTATVVESN